VFIQSLKGYLTIDEHTYDGFMFGCSFPVLISFNISLINILNNPLILIFVKIKSKQIVGLSATIFQDTCRVSQSIIAANYVYNIESLKNSFDAGYSRGIKPVCLVPVGQIKATQNLPPVLKKPTGTT
jgi:hypothetical protein